MNLYTLDYTFQKDISIDKFQSLIWAERYSDAGDFVLSVPATPEMFTLLPLNTRLQIDDSPETMIIDTQSIKDGTLTVSGKSLISFLVNRIYRAVMAQYTTSGIITTKISSIIQTIVQTACAPGANVSALGLDNAETLPFLEFIDYDNLTDVISLDVSVGDVFSLIQNIATTYAKGISLRVASATDSGFALAFITYVGSDRTSGQSNFELVRFSPGSKSLVNTTELYSNATYKNTVYTYASSLPATVSIAEVDTPLNPRLGYATDVPNYNGFDRRSLILDVDTINIDNYGTPTDITALETQIAADLDVAAKNALANNTFTKNVDGEIVPQSPYIYGQDYFLGDVIELQGTSGLIQNARITEYIRSEDNTGEKAYPTVAVID